ncbi:MAG: arylsulfatase [Planctomycetota bacterium]
MTSKTPYAICLALFHGVCSFDHQAPAVAAEPNQRPNLVIVYTDDQGVGDVSSSNPDAKFVTPSMDRLAREGATFTDGHSSDSVCTPSRYGLLTGRYSWRTWLKRGVLGADVNDGLIEDGRMTLATLLRDQGYRTGMFGKWHLGMQFDGELGQRDWSKPFRDGPIDNGFEEFFGIAASMNYGVLSWLEGDRVTRPADRWTAKKPGLVTYDRASYRITPPYVDSPRASPLGGPLEVADDFDDVQALRRFTDRAVEFIERHREQPFFAYVPLTSPHKPVVAAPEFRGRSQCGAYGDFMMETDFRLGQILDVLDRYQLTEETIVILTSDNGAENTHRRRAEEFGHESCGGLRGCKRDLYEGGHRVPFIVRWPAVLSPGRVIDEPVSQTDVLATLAEIIGAPLPSNAGEDSQSLAGLWRGDPFEHGPLVHHGARGQFAIRDGKWKLLLPKSGHELYDLEADIGELHDIASDHPDVVARLLERLSVITDSGFSRPGAVGRSADGQE